VRTALDVAQIKQNQVERVHGGGIFMDEDSSAEHVVIENNQLLEIAMVTAATGEGRSFAGIQVVRAAEVDVLNNMLRDVGTRVSLATRLAGIQAIACSRVRIAGNRVTELGPVESFLKDVDAIAVLGLHQYAEIVDNTVHRHIGEAGADASAWRAVRIGPLAADQREGLILSKALLVQGESVEAWINEKRAFIRTLALEASSVRGNTLFAYGREPAVRIVSRGRVALNDNRATLLQQSNIPVVLVASAAVIMDANYLDNGHLDVDQQVCVVLQVPKNAFTVLGNLASGPIRIGGSPLPEPWKSLNQTLS
jgi:hypothetical protein